MNQLCFVTVQSKSAFYLVTLVTLLLIPSSLPSPVHQHRHQKHQRVFGNANQFQLRSASVRIETHLRQLVIPGQMAEDDDDVETDVIGTESCPKPPKVIPENSCTAIPCTGDEDCGDFNKTCCFNGCLYTCLSSAQPPALIDWQTLSAQGNGDILLEDVDYEFKSGEDLIESHNRQTYIGELCTTTIDEDGIPPLACPHGYICHVENQGNPEKGIPDSGRCMRFQIDADDEFNSKNFE